MINCWEKKPQCDPLEFDKATIHKFLFTLEKYFSENDTNITEYEVEEAVMTISWTVYFKDLWE